MEDINNKKIIKKFFYVETLYSLFISLIIESNLNENFYFFSSKFPKIVRDNLKNKIIIKEVKSIKLLDYIINSIFFRIIKLIFYKKIKNKNFYIHDEGKYAQYFFNNFDGKFIGIEDGTLNYSLYRINKEIEKTSKTVKFSKKLKRRFCYGITKIYTPLGVSEKIEKIILTGILPIPEIIKDKVELINIEEKWKNLSEEEKIDMYREILEERDIKEVSIKEHPREQTNYVNELKDIKVNIIKKEFPIEILSLLNIKFDKVITIFSTAALNFKGKSEIEFIGTRKYSKLQERFGILEEQGTRNKEQGTRNKEQGTRNKEQGTKDNNIFKSINK